MKLTAVEATLIGTGIGATATIVTATVTTLATQRGTRIRERNNRLWDRKVDALEDVLRSTLGFTAARVKGTRDQSVPDLTKSGYDDGMYERIEAKLHLYSPLLVTANDEVFTRFKAWLIALMSWAQVNDASSAHYEQDQQKRDSLWQEVIKAAEQSEIAEQKLELLLRREATMLPHKRWFQFWRR